MTATVEQMIFWASAGVLAYVYVGYPVLVWLLGALAPKKVRAADLEPNVTVLITAFNEAASIRRKIENTLALDYPATKLEVLVASDGSTDGTDEIVGEFASAGVKLFRQEGRVGKTVTQNNAVRQAAGEIVLFSDATTTYREDTLKLVMPAFADATVGCVAGRLVYVDDANSTIGKGAQSYWGYETFVKMAESRACSLIGASGCLYAVRRSAYEPMYAEACSDFLICTLLYRKGLRTIFEPNAVCFEETNRDPADEMQMRVRVIVQSLTDLWRNRDMLNPFKSGFFAIELVSHKLLRYLIPLLLLTLLATSAILAASSPLYSIILAIQALFYLMAFCGLIMERFGRRVSLLAMPMYFLLANVASGVALYKFLRGERMAQWEPIRDPR